MTFGGLVPLALLATSLVTALVIFPLGEERHRARTVVNLVGATLKVAIVVAVFEPVLGGAQFAWTSSLAPGRPSPTSCASTTPPPTTRDGRRERPGRWW